MRKLLTLFLTFCPSLALAGVHVQQGDPFLNIGSMTVTGAGGENVTFGLIAGSITASNIGNGHCVQAGPGGILNDVGFGCGFISQTLLVATQTWSGQNNWTTPAQSSFTYGLTAGSLTVQNLTSGQCVQAGTGGILTVTGSACSAAGTGLLTSTQTWSGQNNWTTTGQSTFTFGITVGSMNVNGVGNGAITFTLAPTGGITTGTYNVPSSSVTPTIGNFAVFTSTNWTLGNGGTGGGGGTPGSPGNSIQYNNAGSFAGSNSFQINGTSVTILSSTTFGVGNNVTSGFVDIHPTTTAGSGNMLFAIGSSNQNGQFTVPDQKPVTAGLGITAACVRMGLAGTTEVISDACNSGNQFINFWSGGNMLVQSSASGQDIVFLPQQVETMRLSNITGMTVISSSTIKNTVGIIATNTKPYMLILSTNSVPASYSLAVTTNGYFSVETTSLTTVSCGLGSTIIGNNNYMKITPGSGSPTSCTVNFNPPFKNVPICFAQEETGSITAAFSYSETATALTLTDTSLAVTDVHCVGQNE